MCGRFTLVIAPENMVRRFQVDMQNLEYRMRYNIAPGQQVLAIIAEKGKRRMGELRWGLIPSWAKDDKKGFQWINARAESLQEKPSFQKLLSRKRCIIPADSFYEWKETKQGKQPMRIMRKDEQPFAFAGLFDTWVQPDGQKVHTCTIITTTPNDVVAPIHPRMPVILREEDESIWLDREYQDHQHLQSMLIPYKAEWMQAYPVSKAVGNVKNDHLDCIREVRLHEEE
ncbi:SOS response-associated peptidase [Brevibacillus centrosporus]|uniref:Abasic site processing protein n=1 Tax=Brevibacillus centrosporus TaxID=54910 RepID=A0A1I3PIT4_9BACL|nr:SOS response-associated peptidase [Brevibacillus centrosporus]MED4910848.1 SOS response-associated peptidase [Brevibacillus centrosporus]SFJ21219.1 Putative SOS response-associated peptidase YedK [Brevibacillus centrosporus]